LLLCLHHVLACAIQPVRHRITCVHRIAGMPKRWTHYIGCLAPHAGQLTEFFQGLRHSQPTYQSKFHAFRMALPWCDKTRSF
jgi:hypothetical protein